VCVQQTLTESGPYKWNYLLTYLLRLDVKIRPFAGAQDPAGDDPQGQHQYDEDRARTDRHQSLQNESRVELYPIECADTARRRVGEQSAVQKQHSTDEIQPKEHRQRQQKVDRYQRRRDRLAVRVDRPPDEVVRADGRRMNNADDEFDDDLEQRAARHRDAPVVDAVVYHEQLKHTDDRVHSYTTRLE